MSEIQAAIALLTEAGYRVTKPKAKKVSQVGPTFVAKFADGVLTRMTTYCDKTLDWKRGAIVAQAAWRSRHKAWGLPTPPIVEARFERDGVVLKARCF